MRTAANTVVGMLGVYEQKRMAEDVRALVKAAPLMRPTAGGRDMSVRITNAGPWGWVADQQGYRYTDRHPVTGQPWPPIPERWAIVAAEMGYLHAWDCAHVVWYEPGAALGWHRDKTEHSRTGAILTFSLGDPAIWCVRANEEAEETRCTLNSGAVVLLYGETRDYLHRIAKVLPQDNGDLFRPASPLSTPGRLVVSLREGAGPRP
jgi:alkylated DNA repair protein (DNA oxidative demethylase)